MQRLRHIAARHQGCRQFVGAFFGSAKNDGAFHVASIQNPAQPVQFFPGFVVKLINLRNRQLFLADRHKHGFVHIPVSQGTDLLRHRSREQQGLAAFPRDVLHDGFNIIDEPHVEHFIGFIQHQDLHHIQLDSPAPDMVQQSSRRTDDDLYAKTQRPNLAVDRLTAVHRQRLETFELADLRNLFGNLQGQLPGRRHDQRLDMPQILNLLGNGDAECGRLPCPGLRLADHVVSFHNRRNCPGLNRRRLLKSHGLNGGHHFVT